MGIHRVSVSPSSTLRRGRPGGRPAAPRFDPIPDASGRINSYGSSVSPHDPSPIPPLPGHQASRSS